MVFSCFLSTLAQNYIHVMRSFVRFSLALLSTFFMVFAASGQDETPDESIILSKSNVGKGYFSSGMDGNIISTSFFERPGRNNIMTTPRYTIFLHIGMTYHYNFSKGVGMFTGLHLKNIGFIDKYKAEDSTVKRRVYALGVPLAFKFGRVDHDFFFFVGAEANLAINYKEKGFVNRSDKDKFNEWFSERTPLIIPSIFMGIQGKILYTKLNFYPTNFMNPDFIDENGLKPYAGFDARLLTLSIGLNIRNRPLFD